MPTTFFFLHTGQQAQIVCLNRLLPTQSLELALGTMPVQNEVGCRMTGQQRADLPSQFPHLTRQDRGLHLQCGLVVCVDDLAKAHLLAQHFRKG